MQCVKVKSGVCLVAYDVYVLLCPCNETNRNHADFLTSRCKRPQLPHSEIKGPVDSMMMAFIRSRSGLSCCVDDKVGDVPRIVNQDRLYEALMPFSRKGRSEVEKRKEKKKGTHLLNDDWSHITERVQNRCSHLHTADFP